MYLMWFFNDFTKRLLDGIYFVCCPDPISLLYILCTWLYKFVKQHIFLVDSNYVVLSLEGWGGGVESCITIIPSLILMWVTESVEDCRMRVVGHGINRGLPNACCRSRNQPRIAEWDSESRVITTCILILSEWPRWETKSSLTYKLACLLSSLSSLIVIFITTVLIKTRTEGHVFCRHL